MLEAHDAQAGDLGARSEVARPEEHEEPGVEVERQRERGRALRGRILYEQDGRAADVEGDVQRDAAAGGGRGERRQEGRRGGGGVIDGRRGGRRGARVRCEESVDAPAHLTRRLLEGRTARCLRRAGKAQLWAVRVRAGEPVEEREDDGRREELRL